MLLFLNSVNIERILILAYKIIRTYCFYGLFILFLKGNVNNFDISKCSIMLRTALFWDIMQCRVVYIPEELSSHLCRSGSLKSRIV